VRRQHHVDAVADERHDDRRIPQLAPTQGPRRLEKIAWMPALTAITAQGPSSTATTHHRAVVPSGIGTLNIITRKQ
jgi:hypothetical protein